LEKWHFFACPTLKEGVSQIGGHTTSYFVVYFSDMLSLMKLTKIVLPIIVLTIIAVYLVISGQNETVKTSKKKTIKQEPLKVFTVT